MALILQIRRPGDSPPARRRRSRRGHASCSPPCPEEEHAMRLAVTGIAALALLAAVGCSRREDGALGEPRMGDESGFVATAASRGMLEVELGRYALSNVS